MKNKTIHDYFCTLTTSYLDKPIFLFKPKKHISISIGSKSNSKNLGKHEFVLVFTSFTALTAREETKHSTGRRTNGIVRQTIIEGENKTQNYQSFTALPLGYYYIFRITQCKLGQHDNNVAFTLKINPNLVIQTRDPSSATPLPTRSTSWAFTAYLRGFAFIFPLLCTLFIIRDKK